MISKEFEGTDRYEVRGRLGAGTSGEVYLAHDRQLGTDVALKTLRKTDPLAIHRFKTEFRALADVHHPNLVQLYELESAEDVWFFTMELVEGLDFQEHLRSSAPAPYATVHLGQPDCRLRDSLRQLAEGLNALHNYGKLHCDLKPSNIRVTPEGRVVLLDFGLVKELFSGQIYETIDGQDVTGTPAYMSPEQAAGMPVTAASDWYSVGVILYEALTGRIPFSGGFLKILSDKQRLDPRPPGEIVGNVDPELAELCMRLQSRDPGKRPTGEWVLERLGGTPEVPARLTHSSSSSMDASFVGRAEQLRKLSELFAETRRGRTGVAFVGGSSGMGKSALVRRFVHQVRQEHEHAVILQGRCYERESVPYKAFDALIDVLSRYLRQLPDHEVEVLLPTNVLALARLFPALRRVQAIAGAHRRVLDIPDSQEQRRRAFSALRELLTRLGQRVPLLLYIDDLQWGDLDSAALLSELLRPPDSPPMMLVACYRSEERDSSPLLGQVLAKDFSSRATEPVELSVQELSPDEARELALELLGDRSANARSLAETIARESGGSPFFIDELVRYSRAETGFDPAGGRSLSDEVARALDRRMSLVRLIHARLERLPPEPRRLIEVVAVAGQPVDLDSARQAAELGRETQAAITILRGASLCRIRSAGGRPLIETYHDRISLTVLKGLEAETRKRLHRRLALALEGSGHADYETLASHFYEAGDSELASSFAAKAADQAADSLAFDRASRLYRLALGMGQHEPEGARQLRIQLGDALSNAGRGAEAATVFQRAAEGARAGDVLELRRRAAEQMLISGHVDEGIQIVRQVLASHGMKLADSPRKALLSLLRRLLVLKLRGYKFKERDTSQIAAEDLIKVDTCWSVSVGLSTVDTIRGMDMAKLHLLLALQAGEPYRVARALAMEAGYSSTGGSKSQEHTAELLQSAMALAERVNNPHALGLTNLMAGMAAYLEGHWKKGLDLLDRAESILRESCTGVTWELNTAMAFQLRALLFLGDLNEIRRRLPRHLKAVQEKADLYAEVNLRSRVAWVVDLLDDRPDLAREEVDGAIGRWSRRGFHVQHYWHFTGRVEIALYEGDALRAWDELERRWRRMERSLLLRIQLTRHEAFHTRGRAALAAATALGLDTRRGRELIKIAETASRKLEAEKLFWALPLAQLLAAGVASVRGEVKRAEDLLVTAAAGFETADMGLCAVISRRRRGQLLDDSGRALVREADRWLATHGVVGPGRLADVVAPGAWPTAAPAAGTPAAGTPVSGADLGSPGVGVKDL